MSPGRFFGLRSGDAAEIFFSQRGRRPYWGSIALGFSGQRPRRSNLIKRDEAIGDEDELDIVDTARHDEQAVLSMCTDTRGSRYKLASTSICQNS